MKKSDFNETTKYVWVGWPLCQELEQIEDYENYSNPCGDETGYFVEYDWLMSMLDD